MPVSRGLEDSPSAPGSLRAFVGRRSSARSGLRIQSYGTPPRPFVSRPAVNHTPSPPVSQDDLDLLSPFARRLRITSKTPSRPMNDVFLATRVVKGPEIAYTLTPPPSSPTGNASLPRDVKMEGIPSPDGGAGATSGW